MRKAPEDYLSVGVQKLLDFPDRAKAFLKTHLIEVKEMTVMWKGKQHTIKSVTDIDWLPDEIAVWAAKVQMGTEMWWATEEGQATMSAFEKVR